MASSFGQLVRSAREGRGWSQAELGVKVGRSGVQISRVENGERDASLELFHKLLRVLGLDPKAAHDALDELGVSMSSPPGADLSDIDDADLIYENAPTVVG
jgi:transcriptional regulator with XRE-family HTH domain